jgi:hypothetical protein
MKRLLVLLIPAVLLAGCAHRHFRLDGAFLEIYVKAPGSAAVFFASSLDGYELHPATRAGRNTWSVRVPADSEFSYFFKVDGRMLLPECEYREYDEFGSKNCVYIPGM